MKKIKFYSFLLLTTFGLLGLNACTGDDDKDPEPTETGKTTYADAKVIIDASCSIPGCHISGAATGSLANYADAKTFAQGGKMVKAMKYEDGVSKMPPTAKAEQLAADKIAVIEKWIADGLLEK